MAMVAPPFVFATKKLGDDFDVRWNTIDDDIIRL